MGWLTLVSVIVNALAAIVAPLIARKMADKTAAIQKAESALETVSAGMGILEQAVEANKDALSKSGPGNVIAQTVTTYGPAAKTLVDTARQVALTVRLGAEAAYVASALVEEVNKETARRAALLAEYERQKAAGTAT